MKTETNMLDLPYLARRIIAAREQSGLSQEKLSKLLGFKDRQTLTAIEGGQRKVAAEELLEIMRQTNRDWEFFTDPFRMVGEAKFSYRASGCAEETLLPFEERVGQWLALWRHLGEKRQEPTSPLRPRLALNQRSTFEEAQTAGQQLAEELQLGPVPAARLAAAIEEKFSILLLFVDMPTGASGAAVQVLSGDAILINRQEPACRRAFDLAHELFHVLTWDVMPPERVDRETPTSYKSKRTEQLADNFAGALLLPAPLLTAQWQGGEHGLTLVSWLTKTATHFQVSLPAVAWRLFALKLLTREEILPVLASTEAPGPETDLPWFSRRFLDRVAWGIQNGEISVRRALQLLDLDLEALRAQCARHEVAIEIGL